MATSPFYHRRRREKPTTSVLVLISCSLHEIEPVAVQEWYPVLRLLFGSALFKDTNFHEFRGTRRRFL